MSVQGSSPDVDRLCQQAQEFTSTVNKVVHGQISVLDFVLDLSHVLDKSSELHFNVLGFKNKETETNGSDCIDKVALPENKEVPDTMGDIYPSGCAHFSDSTSDPDIPHEGNFIPTCESNSTSWKCSHEEFENLKLAKDNVVSDLARCSENLETTRTQLQETEQLLAEAKSQLASAQKLNSLAETQLKCMAESYKALETRAEELLTEVNLLQSKNESLDNELKEEKRNHQDALAKCKDLQEQLQRNENESTAAANQEKELAAAAEKLAECQETIFLLGKQLKSLCPQTEFMRSPYSERSQKGEAFEEEEPSTTGGMNSQDSDQVELERSTSTSNLPTTGGDCQRDLYNSPFSDAEANNNLLKSPVNSKNQKHHRQTKSISSPSALTPEKHSRGISRFFSSKGKNGY
ncbi:hypothetical protein NMG60_11016160 [Bertholletia excelsa]